jgi:hypothetical protein
MSRLARTGSAAKWFRAARSAASSWPGNSARCAQALRTASRRRSQPRSAGEGARAGNRSGCISLNTLQKRRFPIWEELGLEPIGLHDSRHTCATWLDDAGVSPEVASALHLLLDVLEESIDAAIVVSNDSDLRFPIQQARTRVPVGTVNPSPSRLAGDLKGRRTDGVGDHWWAQLGANDVRAHQLPDPCGKYRKPAAW